MDTVELSREVKKTIMATGASACGFAKARMLQREYDFLMQWLSKGYHAEKAYLERNPKGRANPEIIVPGARTVIAVLFNYYTHDEQGKPGNYSVSRYAHGRDYHLVLNERLAKVAGYIMLNTESLNTRVFVDSAPIFEKAWAQRAGLGWIGKNTLLVNENTGTFHFIGLIVTDIELIYDKPVEDKCGDCNLCIEACPTDALKGPHELDVRKCLSHLTMEQKNPLPEEMKEQFCNFIYGCDLCQEACPWNKDLKPCDDKDFLFSEALKNMTKEDWENLTEEKFKEISEHSAMRRVGFAVLKRNIDFLK